jgi:epoxyqueuosine reductase
MPTTVSAISMTNAVKAAAREAGFELAGISSIGEFPELKEYPNWIAGGRAGEMKYLEARDEQGRLKRASVQHVAPWARSVIVCASNYNTAQPYSIQCTGAERGWISRYAWTREDYHDSLMRKLRVLEERIRSLASEYSNRAVDRRNEEEAPSQSPSGSDVRTWCYVDTGPLVERVYAKYAGVGWIGKNTCILNEEMGSWLFLGVILTSLELAPDLPPADRCGTCKRCLEACPTNAFLGPYQLDATRCISYLTIEKRGAIPEELREGIGRHVFGCDICQDVCPWNRKAPVTDAPEFQPREGLVNPALEWLAAMQPEEFRNTFRGSPIKRAKLSGLRRNALIAMGNSGQPQFIPVLEKFADDEDPVLAEAARWALEKLQRA